MSIPLDPTVLFIVLFIMITQIILISSTNNHISDFQSLGTLFMNITGQQQICCVFI